MGIKTVQDSSLTAVADAIRAKGGTSAQLAFPAGFVSAVEAIPTGGGTVQGNVADCIALVPAFDDTWKTTEFSILSYPSSGHIEVPHTLGTIPSYAVILKTDITLEDIGGVIGGYNFVGGAKTDSALNRTIKFDVNSAAGSNYNLLPTTYKMGFGLISNTNWNLVSGSAISWTSSIISFRATSSKNTTTGFCLGQYILGVK